MHWKAMFRKKYFDPESLLVTKLKRCLTLWDLIFFGVGVTLGPSLYIVAGQVSRDVTGPSIVISFLFAAVANILSGLSYAEFAVRVPKAGASYIFTYVVLGEVVAFVVAWSAILVNSIGTASVVRGMSSYVDAMAGGWVTNTTLKYVGELRLFGSALYVDMLSFGYTLVGTVVLCFGVRNSSLLNNLSTFVNLLSLIMLVVMGSFYARWENVRNFAPKGISGIVSGSPACFYCLIGFEAICAIAEEAKSPGRAVPISIVSTVGICFVVYVAASLVVNMMVPYYMLNGSAAISEAFVQVGAKSASYVVAAGAVFGFAGCTLVSLMLLPRYLYYLARDGLVFRIFAHICPCSAVPVFSTLFSGLLTGFMAMLIDISSLVELTAIGTLLGYSLVDLSIIVVRYRCHPHEDRSKFSDRDALNANAVLADECCAADEQVIISDSLTSSGPSLLHTLQSPGSSLWSTLWQPTPTMRPSSASERIVIACILLLSMAMVAFTGFLALLQTDITSGKLSVLLPFLFSGVVVFLLTGIISRMPQNSENLFYRVPAVPWIPVLAITFNMYLMYHLKPSTWYGFLIWLAIGAPVYIFYGFWHSEERCQGS